MEFRGAVSDNAYADAIQGTKDFFADVEVHAFSPIFQLWASSHVGPLWSTYAGVTATHSFFAKYLGESSRRTGGGTFASIGSGTCEIEVDVAKALRDAGVRDFTIECFELNPDLLEKGRVAAVAAGVEENLRFTQSDFNAWLPPGDLDGVMVCHALHHVVNLEGLYDQIKAALKPGANFVVADMIGRNGHMRWPEALAHVHRFWADLPKPYRYNRLLHRWEDLYENWDCSTEAFEGIRAQDVLPLLVERFKFELFVAYSNVIDVFVDRCFGPNFDAAKEWDRDFITKVNAFDEAEIVAGRLTPTQMIAVLRKETPERRIYARGLSPERSIRRPN